MEWAFTEVEKSVKGAGFDELHAEFAFGHANVEMLAIIVCAGALIGELSMCGLHLKPLG